MSMRAKPAEKSDRMFKFSIVPTSGVFTSSGLLWDRDTYEWPSKDGKRLPFARVIAGLELDAERIRSMRDPQLQLDLLGVPTDPFQFYERNDYNRQLQRMYIQLMRPDRFRHYVGTGNVFFGWQYPLGRENNIVDELLNVAPSSPSEAVMYGPNPKNRGGEDDWADRMGYRVPIKRGSEASTFSFTEEDLKLRFENVLDKTQSSAASKLLKDEEDWRLNSGVQYFYEVEVRIHPLLNQPPKPGEKFTTPDEFGRMDESIYTPGDDWMNRPSLTVEFQGKQKTINQLAALETVYSVTAGRVGCGVPVVSMGPHLIDGDWKLVSIRVLPESHLWDVLLETQTFIDSFDSLEGSAVNGIRKESATNLMMARLASFQLCVSKLAQVGFLHLGLSAVNVFQGTIWKPGSGGEGSFPAEGQFFKGAGASHVRDFRPSNVSIVRLPVDVCENIMLTILVLDLYVRDSKRKLGFLDALAALLVPQLANMITSRASNPQFEHLYRLLMLAWEFFYEDAKLPAETNSQTAPQVLRQPSPTRSRAQASISPSKTSKPPRPIKARLRQQDAATVPLHLDQGETDDNGPGNPPESPYTSKTLNTARNPSMFSDLFSQREFISFSSRDIGSSAVDGARAGMKRASASVGAYGGNAFDFDADRLASYIASKSDGWKPPRDTLVLALRMTHRLYELARGVAYQHTREQANAGVGGLDADLLKPDESLVPPYAVRRFCGDPNPTESALELAASCLKKYASE